MRKTLRRIAFWAMFLTGLFPIVTWLWYAGYMLYIGPKIGWMSREFLDIESTSFLWCAGMFAGVAIVGIACGLVLPHKEDLNG